MAMDDDENLLALGFLASRVGMIRWRGRQGPELQDGRKKAKI